MHLGDPRPTVGSVGDVGGCQFCRCCCNKEIRRSWGVGGVGQTDHKRQGMESNWTFKIKGQGNIEKSAVAVKRLRIRKERQDT